MDKSVLLKLMCQPLFAKELDLSDWDYIIPCARQEGVLGWLYQRFKSHDILHLLPPLVYPHLKAAAIVATEHERMVHWEVNRIQRALREVSAPVILLKGAAYVMLNLPCAQGRLLADVDILVPKKQISLVEKALKAHNWEPMMTDEYDQKYYRQWMHELPPLRHRLRGTDVDVHHTILPLTNRLTPNPELLFSSALVLPDNTNNSIANPSKNKLLVLAPADMVLHSMVHAFYDSDLSQCLRNLVDLHTLIEYFADEDPHFWQQFIERTYQLGLQRPAYYALRYCKHFMRTSVPTTATQALAKAAPGKPVIVLMDYLINRALLYEYAPIAQGLLYMRSHWLRMPPLLLAKHLLHKTHKRIQERWAASSHQITDNE